MASPLDRLNPRERRLVSVLGVFLGAALVLAVPLGLEAIVRSRDADNQELHAALTQVQEKKEHLLQRYAKKAPALAGFLEQAATKEKLELMDTDKRPDIPHGKRYVERSTAIHLKKAGLVPITEFLESIEKSGYPIEVSHLTMRKRLGEPDSYDVQVGVSVYDRNDVSIPSTPATPTPEKTP